MIEHQTPPIAIGAEGPWFEPLGEKFIPIDCKEYREAQVGVRQKPSGLLSGVV